MKLLVSPFFFWIFLSSSLFAGNHQPQFPIHFDFFPTEFANIDFDPNQITVEDPKTKFYVELSTGDYHLASFTAPPSLIEEYSTENKIENGALKDNPKVPGCTRAEIEALKLWTTNDIYKDVNKVVRGAQKGKLNGQPIEKKLEQHILMIASGVNCAPQISANVVRMETPPEVITNQYQPGKMVGLRGFTSTSNKSKPTQWFLDHEKYLVRVDNATGADIGSLDISPWPEEKEVLLRPGTVFRVKSKKDYPAGSKPLREYRFEQVYPE